MLRQRIMVDSNQTRDGGIGRAEFARRVAITLLMTGTALLIYAIADILLLIFGAVFIAVILRSIADPISRLTGLPGSFAAILALLIILGVFGLIGWMFGSQISGQFTDLIDRAPDAWSNLQQRLQGSTIGSHLLSSQQNIKPDARDIASRFAGILSTAGNALANAIVVLFAGLYLAVSPTLYRKGVTQLFPRQREEQVGSAIDNSGRALRKWLLGQLVSMAVVGILTGVGLWLIGVPAPVALGLIAAVAEFIPMVGPVLAAIPGILIALTAGPGVAVWALAVYLIVQQVESNLITPVVENRAVSLPPALTLLGVLALGFLFGPLGVVLSAPLVVVLYVLVKQLYVRDTLGHDTKISG